MIRSLRMEMAVKNEILIHTVGLSGFKALAHTHWVLSPQSHCTEGASAPWGVEKGLCWPLCWAHSTLCVAGTSRLKTGAAENYRLPNTFLRLLQNKANTVKNKLHGCLLEILCRRKKINLQNHPPATTECTSDFPRITTSSSSSPLPLFILSFKMTRQSAPGVRLIKGLFLGEI